MLLRLLASACFAVSVTAHATFQELWVNGVDQGDCCARLPQNNNPVTDVTSTDIVCNASPSPSSGLCSVPAGATLTVEMHQQPGDRTCSNQAIGGNHYGPITVYMAKVNDATTAAASGQSWFKVSEMGLPSSNPDYWATEVLNDNCGHYSFTIPKDITSGNYLLRAEAIALHVADSVGGAQFYMSCYQINVTGGGSNSPPGVSFPGAYGASDPGILINIYTQLNAYTIPGPQPYESASPAVATTAWPTQATWATAGQPSTVPHTCPGGVANTVQSSSGGHPTTMSQGPTPTTSKPTTTVKATTTTTTTTTTTPHVTATTTTTTPHTTTPTPPPSNNVNAAAVQHWGQCGGQGWNGGTVCQAPYACQYSNPWYSQCL